MNDSGVFDGTVWDWQRDDATDEPCMIGPDSGPKKKMRYELLDRAGALVGGDRARDYGDAYEMHARIAAGWSQILGREVKPHEAALCMAWVKIARLVVTEDHADSYVDLVAYGALAGEIQQRDSALKRNSVARTSGHVADGACKRPEEKHT